MYEIGAKLVQREMENAIVVDGQLYYQVIIQLCVNVFIVPVDLLLSENSFSYSSLYFICSEPWPACSRASINAYGHHELLHEFTNCTSLKSPSFLEA